MPLNRLHVRVIDYPQTKDAIAMVSKLEYEDKYDKVSVNMYILYSKIYTLSIIFVSSMLVIKPLEIMDNVASAIKVGGQKHACQVYNTQLYCSMLLYTLSPTHPN